MDKVTVTRKHIVSIKTKRLLLRNVIPDDKQFLIELWTNPDVTKYMGGPRDSQKLSMNLEENINNPFQDEYDLWILVEKESQNPVGHCGLLKKEVNGKNETELIYVIKEDFWGKGYASEIARAILQYAFREKKLTSVIALIKPENKASEKVAVKIGMEFEREVIRKGNTKMLLYRKIEGNKVCRSIRNTNDK